MRSACVPLIASANPVNPLLCQAIAQRKVVRFAYRGGYRDVEPHCHGVTSRGHEVLRGYQIAGYSRSDDATGWRLFRLDGVADLGVIEQSFQGPRRGYDPHDKDMETIYCHL
jgi:predicted DNA-binding transcriptional regulator YafY